MADDSFPASPGLTKMSRSGEIFPPWTPGATHKCQNSQPTGMSSKALQKNQCVSSILELSKRTSLSVLSDVTSIPSQLKDQKTNSKILWENFCQQTLAQKLGCRRAAIRMTAVVLWPLFVLFLSILRQIQSGIFESSVRRCQHCIDNVFICVSFAKKGLWCCPFDRVDREQRHLRTEMHRFQ